MISTPSGLRRRVQGGLHAFRHGPTYFRAVLPGRRACNRILRSLDRSSNPEDSIQTLSVHRAGARWRATNRAALRSMHCTLIALVLDTLFMGPNAGAAR